MDSSATNLAIVKHVGHADIQPSACKEYALKTSKVAFLVILLLGSVAALGGYSGSSLGWFTIGCGTGGFVISYLASRKPNDHKWISKAELVAAFALFLIGILGATGVISNVQVGQGIIGMFVIATMAHLARGSFGDCLKTKKPL